MADPAKLPSTKSNLMILSEELEVFRGGWEILKEKKELLMSELTRLRFRFEKVNEKTTERFLKYNDDLVEILKTNYFEPGKNELFKLEFEMKHMFGTFDYSISVDMLEGMAFQDSLEGIGPSKDVLKNEAESLFEMLSEWLRLYSTLYSMLIEINKTAKRVRSLENIFIPKYETIIKRMRGELEEKEREEFVQKKKIKEGKRDDA